MRIAVLFALMLALVATSIVAQSRIRKVDFKNFDYRLTCGTADRVSRVRVRNGVYSGPKRGIDVYLKIYDLKYGDLDGDGGEEAVVLYACGSGTSYVFFRAFVFGMKRNRPNLLGIVEGGNKGDGGFHDIVINRPHLIVERYQLDVAGSPCCPTFIESTKYLLKRRKLIQAGCPSVRRIPREK